MLQRLLPPRFLVVGKVRRTATEPRNANVLGGWWAKLKFWVGDTAFMGLNWFHWEYEKRKDRRSIFRAELRVFGFLGIWSS